MNTTAKITLSVLALAGLGYGVFASGVLAAPCAQPLTYRVGTIDDRFGISENTAKRLLRDAETAWESAAERELFAYQAQNAQVPVNFVYDDRQRRTDAAEVAESNLDDLIGSHENISADLKQKRENFRSRVQAFESDQASYQRDLNDYNETVRSVNESSSVTEKRIEELKTKKQQLADRRADLRRRQSNLKEQKTELNRLVSKANQLVESYNSRAENFNDRFSGSRAFDQAVYKEGEINVYQFESEDDLRLALAHELGHALGIDHVEDEDAVMYYLMQDQPRNPLEITPADRAALHKVCGQ
jgi:DNA repair exonuclease SbcCD ATPase subunit